VEDVEDVEGDALLLI